MSRYDELLVKQAEMQKELDALKKQVHALKLENSDLDLRLKDSGMIHQNTQPILGRLLAMGCLLEKKGIYNVRELTEIQEEQAEAFTNAADQAVARAVRNQSGDAGTVANDRGDGRTGLSGTPSDGGNAASSESVEDGTRSRIVRLSDVRAAREASDTTPHPSEIQKEDLSAGEGKGTRSDDNTVRD
jgi:hypothetical protein